MPRASRWAAQMRSSTTFALEHGKRAVEIFWRDLWYGVRTLVRSPGFTVIAVLTLALGIGANTAIFQLLDAVRLRNLPVSESQRTHGRAPCRPAGQKGQPGDGLSGTEQSSLGIFSRPSARLFAGAGMESHQPGHHGGRSRAVGARPVGEWRLLQCAWECGRRLADCLLPPMTGRGAAPRAW